MMSNIDFLVYSIYFILLGAFYNKIKLKLL
jgi:hypothetical protein